MLKEFTTVISGRNFYPTQASLRLGENLRLVRDPLNTFDPNAIRIELDPGQTVGFLPKELAAQFAKDLDSGKSSSCYVCENSGNELFIAVAVYTETTLLKEYLEQKKRFHILKSRMERIMRLNADKGMISIETVTPPRTEFAELQFVLGNHFLGQSDKYSLSLHYLGYAALNGHSAARELLNEFYAKDESGQYTYTFANAGHPNAQYEIGQTYFLRKKDPQPRRALKYWRCAALQGHKEAQKRLAYVYEFGDGVPRDLEASRFWREKLKKSESSLIPNEAP